MVEWKEITGFPGYEVSNNGQVRRGTSIKAQFADRKGYLSVRLWMHGKSHTRFVARLVAAAFIGERPEGMVVCHINGIKDDNHVENLKYGTPTENEHDKRRHGTAPIGERHPAAKLTEDKVLTIRARYRARFARCAIPPWHECRGFPRNLMTDQYESLRKAAQEATPGPWSVYRPHYSYSSLGIDGPGGVAVAYFSTVPAEGIPEEADAHFIAAANPATILALLAERDALREALWVCAEHNALHFGETHNTVAQARAALNQEASK